jgi:hypothetical protein
MVIVTIASSKKPGKSKIKSSEIPAVISYNGETYKIKMSELRNLGLDHIDKIVEMSISKGLDPLPYFSKQCLFCSNNNRGIMDFFQGEIPEDKLGTSCHYKSDLNLKIAEAFIESKTNRTFRAIDNNCAFYDSLVYVLDKENVLSKYKEDITFNFRNIEDFERKLVKPKDHQIKGPNLVEMIRGAINI